MNKNKKRLLEKASENYKRKTFAFKQSDRSKRDLHMLIHFMIEQSVPITMTQDEYFGKVGFDLKAYFGEEDLEISLLQDVLKITPWNEDGTYDQKQIDYVNWLYHHEFPRWFASNTVGMMRKWLKRPTAALRKKIKPGGHSKPQTSSRMRNVDWLKQ